MNYLTSVLITEDISSEDDIDRLFSQLEQIKPPASLVDSILASVSQLAQFQHSQDIWSRTYGLIAHSEDREPS